MNFDEINKLWDRFEASSLSEFEIDTEETHLRLKRPEVVQVAQSVAVAKPAVETEQANATKSEGKGIKAPLVGTFYAAPSPDAKPFVSVGAQVKKGDVVGIIEAMKLMNEVTATEDGTVSEILVSDGSFVEYDQMLISLK